MTPERAEQDEATRHLLNASPEPSPQAAVAASPVAFPIVTPLPPLGSLGSQATPVAALDRATAALLGASIAPPADLDQATAALLATDGAQPPAELAGTSEAPPPDAPATPQPPSSSAALQDVLTQQLIGGPPPVPSTPQAQDVLTSALMGSGAAPIPPPPPALGPSQLQRLQEAQTQYLLGTPSTLGAPSPVTPAPQSFVSPLVQNSATAMLLNTTIGSTFMSTPAQQDEATQRLLIASGVQEAVASATPRSGALDAAARRAQAVQLTTTPRQESGPTCFRLAVTGEIESAQLGPGGGGGPLTCDFAVKHGADWSVVSGVPHGVTQLARAAPRSVAGGRGTAMFAGCQREVVWNFPMGIVFKSTSPFGWPRICVTIYGRDMCNRRIIKGYGSVHVPCQPGRHTRTIRLYRPLSSSPLTRILGALFGNPAELVDPKLVAGTEGREVIRVQSGGKVRLVFDVLLKDTESFNYSF